MDWNFVVLMFEHLKTFPGAMLGPTQNLGLIGYAAFMSIGYKQTNRQTDKQSIYRLGF